MGWFALTTLHYKVFWVCPQRRPRASVPECAPALVEAVAFDGAATDRPAARTGSVDLAGVGEQDARRMAVVRVALVSVLLALSAIGCENKPDLPEKGPPPIPPRPATAMSDSPAPSGSAPPSASIALLPAPGDSAFAGTWEGTYDAKKGAVVLPERVKDKTRGNDDGKLMSGAGKIELVVGPGGEVRGKATGALGDAHLTGKLDEGGSFLRASWYPDDATKPNAMTGVLYGPVKDGVIAAVIRVAGPDAVLVRESKVDLKKR